MVEPTTSAQRMAAARIRRKQRGLIQITVWVTEEQKEFLNRMAKDLDGSISDAAQILIYKNAKQLKALGVFK